MKKIQSITGVLFAVALSGCVAPTAPSKLEIVKINLNASPDDLYSAMTQCVLDNIDPPASGQLFTYQSEKNSQLAFVYGLDARDSYFPAHATIRFSGKQKTIKAQGVKWYIEPTPYITGGWRTAVNQNVEYKTFNSINRLTKTLSDCLPTYLNQGD